MRDATKVLLIPCSETVTSATDGSWLVFDLPTFDLVLVVLVVRNLVLVCNKHNFLGDDLPTVTPKIRLLLWHKSQNR